MIRDLHKLSFHLRSNSTFSVLNTNFTEFFNFTFIVNMASGRSSDVSELSDEEQELFAGFTVEKIG